MDIDQQNLANGNGTTKDSKRTVKSGSPNLDNVVPSDLRVHF
jgi:hypothetical protein